MRSEHIEIPVRVIVVVFLCIGGLYAITLGQTKPDSVPDKNIREQKFEPKTARAYPAGGDKPIPWTEAERSPNVMERPRFLRALFETLQPVLRKAAPGIRVDEGRIDRDRINATKNALSTILQPGIVPSGWRGVEIYGIAQRFKMPPAGVLERADIPRELDLTVPIEHLEPTDNFYAEWSAGGIEILADASAMLRLKLPDERRMQLSPKPRDFVERANNQDYFWDFFDRKALHSLLTTVFQVPFATEDDFVLEGYTRKLEGVQCFFGKLQSKESFYGGRHGSPKPRPAWWDRISIFVTDSDPQYFCVGISFPSASDPTVGRMPAGE